MGARGTLRGTKETVMINEVNEQITLFTNIWNGYDKRVFLKSDQEAIDDKKTSINDPTDFIGTFRLVAPEYLEAIINQRQELAEQLEAMTAAAQKYKVMFEKAERLAEEEKKAVWDRACEKMRAYCLTAFATAEKDRIGLSIINAPKPEYKP